MTTRPMGLNEPFESIPPQREAAVFGVWIFLASEMLFFGVLFLGYSVYRFLYPAAFAAAGAETNIWYGTLNTFILLSSSATMAFAVWSAHAKLKKPLQIGLALTALLGLAFMVIKGLEYAEDFEKHLVPGSSEFPIGDTGAEIFFSFYWIMTGVHAVHLTVGIIAVAAVLAGTVRNRIAWSESAMLHVLGLYWHLVDLIWIFLYPLLYLLGR